MATPKKKQIVKIFRLQLPAGKATPAPPVGPALSQHSLNIMEFVNQFNKMTAKMEDDMIVPVDIQVHQRQDVHPENENPAGCPICSRKPPGF